MVETDHDLRFPDFGRQKASLPFASLQTALVIWAMTRSRTSSEAGESLIITAMASFFPFRIVIRPTSLVA
jgi:hypothetical protein